MQKFIVGISAYYHDSAVTIIRDGDIIAASQEERFTRKKHDPGFPEHALRYCLKEANIKLTDVDYVVFYDKPLLKFERILETYLAFAPKGFQSFLHSMPLWIKDKLFLKQNLRTELARVSGCTLKEVPALFFAEHHQSHAASAFFPSPFNRAGVICIDGVGEWATTSIWLGEGNKLSLCWQINFPHSLGLLYSAFTYYLGFKVNSGEYKVMGLAPYGEPIYEKLIKDNLIDIKDDGSYRLNMSYFNYATGLTMTNSKFHSLFGGAPRKPETLLTQREMNIAASLQKVTEEVVMKLATGVKKELAVDNLCLAGGVALNCVANGKILREVGFKNIWVQPAAGDAGGSLGAAMSLWYEYLGNQRVVKPKDSMKGAYLGPAFTSEEIIECLNEHGAVYKCFDDSILFKEVAKLIAQGKVIGWFDGRMEFGPRALGGRSILGDPRNDKMQANMNLKIKYRESFRPFAPSVLSERVKDYFDMNTSSPYMLLVASVQPDLQIKMNDEQTNLFGIDKLNVPKSTIPAVTHVDYSARIQTVHEDTNPRYYKLIRAFEELTGCGVLVNTSFNVRGEPIVHTPEQAYMCFMRTEMDALILGNYVLLKEDQPRFTDDKKWMAEFELD